MNEPIERAVEVFIRAVGGLELALHGGIERSHSYAAIYKLVPFQDGNEWCVLLGENLQDGIAGFGTTPHAAIMEFDRQMFNAKAAQRQGGE